MVCLVVPVVGDHDGWVGFGFWYFDFFHDHQIPRLAGVVLVHRAVVDVRHAYCVSFVADQEHVLDGHSGPQADVSESRDAGHRDLQVWFSGCG